MRAFERRAPLEAADLRSALVSQHPDALLIDAMAFGAVAEAEASGLPWASWLPCPAWRGVLASRRMARVSRP